MGAEMILARKVVERLDELAAITDEPGMITRSFLSPAMARANVKVGGWFADAGGAVERDEWGNVIGRWWGHSMEAPVLLLGSHLDTVRNAGKFDGPMGVLVALAAMELLTARGVRLQVNVEIVGFSDEEGVRFHSAYLGSKGFAGLITAPDLALRDAGGVSVAEAIASYEGIDKMTLAAAKPGPRKWLGYVEVHLEQGPVLEGMGCALGLVESIAAQTRLTCEVVGKAGHAGTTPMTLRQDALVGAAEIVLAVERWGQSEPGLVATVGQLQVEPSVSNVIPARVVFSVDVRHPDEAVVARIGAELQTEAARLATKRGLSFSCATVQASPGVKCSPELTNLLESSVIKRQATAPRLISGAGHDGVVLSQICPVAMLFVRCRAGLSHHPDEHVDVDDIAASIGVLADFLSGIETHLP